MLLVEEKQTVLNSLAAIIFLLALSAAAISFYPQAYSKVESWYDPVVLPSEVRAAEWIDENLPHDKVFAADLFACEMLTAAAGVVCSIGGAWELADNPNDRYSSNQEVFLTDSPETAWTELKKYSLSYVFVADRNSFYAYGWKNPSMQKFSDEKYFRLIHEQGETKVYEVLD